MRIITYLGFTLLSILIQFCVMDYIQEKIKLEEQLTNLDVSSQKKRFDEMLNKINRKPHALYYRTHVDTKNSLKVTSKTYSNISVPETEITTMMTSTIIDEFYDDNISTTEGGFTTDTLYSTTEIDNMTEITLFEKKNQTTVKPSIPKKTLRNKNCDCDLLYKVCDINCCCDSDCAEKDKKLFMNCNSNTKEESQYLCNPLEVSRKIDKTNLFDNLFCVVKTNLPDKRNINSKKLQYDDRAVDGAHKWHKNEFSRHTEFERKPYEYGDTVWVLKDGSIWYIDIPSPTVNNYCSGRRPISFLKAERVECNVRLNDLEMFQIFNTSQESFCVSVVSEKSLDSAALNCSTLHCTNWTIVICDEDGNKCTDYNNTIHEPSCTESYCKNIALQLDYIFYYYDSKIINATIKLLVKTIPNHIPFMTQTINVRYVMSNVSIDRIIKVSGNSGYIYDLPVISSSAKSNHTEQFFNSTVADRKYLTQPTNKNGLCVTYTNNFVKFGINKRLKCRYVHNKPIFSKLNSTDACDDIENNIKLLTGLTEQVYVSALGNPIENKENDWLLINNNLQEKEITYGQSLAKDSRLRCYNLIVRVSYIFTFADVSEVLTKREDKIIAVNISVATQNVTFSAEDVSTVLTIDTNFIDGTKHKAYKYAGAPHLNFHLPKDFFFPFPSNGVRTIKLSVPLMLCTAIYWQIK